MGISALPPVSTMMLERKFGEVVPVNFAKLEDLVFQVLPKRRRATSNRSGLCILGQDSRFEDNFA